MYRCYLWAPDGCNVKAQTMRKQAPVKKMKKKGIHKDGPAKMREDEQLVRTLTERSLVGIYVVQDGQFQSINPNAASYYGCAPEEMMGKRSDSILHPEDKERHRQCARDMLKGKRSTP